MLLLLLLLLLDPSPSCKQIARLVNKLIEIHALTPQRYTKIFVVGPLLFSIFPTTFMLMGLLNSLAQALRRHSWISSFRTPSGKRHIVVIVVIVVVGPLPVL